MVSPSPIDVPRRLGAVLRDAAVVAVVAGLVFQGLRRFVCDRYLVPTGSMQPTLYGDPRHGDVVLVDKLAAAAGLARYDLGVWESPEEPGRQLVKRVAAFGDDHERNWLALREGDLWLGPDAQHLERDVKDPLLFRDLRVTWFEWPPRGHEAVEQFLVIPPGARDGERLRLPSCEDASEVRARCRLGGRHVIGDGAPLDAAWLRTARAVDVSYLDARGNRGREGGNLIVDDVGADVEFAPGAFDEAFCGLDLRPDSWMFHWDRAKGSAELWRNGETVAERPLRGGPSPPARLEFGFLDGRFFFALDGRADRLLLVDRRPEWFRPDAGPAADPGPRNQLHLGLRGAGPAGIARLRVFHDVYWQPGPVLVNEPKPYFVPPGQVFLLGDNSFDSRDSRMFHGVLRTAFVGRPRLILGPWPRWQWLAR